MGRTLLVDDDPGVLFALSELLAVRGHEVTGTAPAREASDHLPVTVAYDPAAVTEPRPLARG